MKYSEIILVKYGEIALKGQNKRTFEDVLVKNIKQRLSPLGEFRFQRAQSTLYITPPDSATIEPALDRISKIFGIAAYCRALSLPKDFEEIRVAAQEYAKVELEGISTFKVEAKRSDKNFPLNSMELTRELGGAILESMPNLKVDVHNPEVVITVEIRDFAAYLHAKRLIGARGLPVGTSGKALLLLSGGIDSPVAGYMMAKRGIEVGAIHFVSPPYTSERAQLKVERLCESLTDYCGSILFYCVPFTDIQVAIRKHCPEELFTVIMRRMMMKIACIIAYKNKYSALITGESVAQVASQTLSAIACTDIASDIPVLRPVIGMDKVDIIDISRAIGTFDTSIEPYEDCCTVFTPKHPRTRPNIKEVLRAEENFDFQPLIEKAAEDTQLKIFN